MGHGYAEHQINFNHLSRDPHKNMTSYLHLFTRLGDLLIVDSTSRQIVTLYLTHSLWKPWNKIGDSIIQDIFFWGGALVKSLAAS